MPRCQYCKSGTTCVTAIAPGEFACLDCVKRLIKEYRQQDSAAVGLINKAKALAAQCNFSFEEALGQVYGGLIFEIDAALFEEGDRLPTGKSLFKTGFDSMMKQWWDDDEQNQTTSDACQCGDEQGRCDRSSSDRG